MQHWIAITSDMLLQSLNRAELDAVNTVADTAAIDDEISDVVAIVREAVANNRGNVMPEDDRLIPRSLRAYALDILRVRLLTRYTIAVSDARKAAADAAHTRLSDIAKGDYLVTAPSGGIPSMPSRTPHVTAPDPTFGSSASSGWWPRPR